MRSLNSQTRAHYLGVDYSRQAPVAARQKKVERDKNAEVIALQLLESAEMALVWPKLRGAATERGFAAAAAAKDSLTSLSVLALDERETDRRTDGRTRAKMRSLETQWG